MKLDSRSFLLCVSVSLWFIPSSPAADKAPSFAKDVKPFLAKYCAECHGAAKPKAGLNVTTFDDLMKGGKKKAVVAGKADESLLVKTMEGKGKPMPPKKYEKQPTAQEIAVIKAWINAGAKDDGDAKGALPPAAGRDERAAARRERDE